MKLNTGMLGKIIPATLKKLIVTLPQILYLKLFKNTDVNILFPSEILLLLPSNVVERFVSFRLFIFLRYTFSILFQIKLRKIKLRSAPPRSLLRLSYRVVSATRAPMVPSPFSISVVIF